MRINTILMDLITSPRTLTVVVAGYILAGVSAFIFTDINWQYFTVIYLLIALGNGTMAHRYFSHGSFEVNPTVRWILGFWATVAAYAPLPYWIVQHRHHHKHTDETIDIHSPVNGLARSFLLWIFDAKAIASIFQDKTSLMDMARAKKDPVISFYGKYFLPVNAAFLTALYIIDPLLLYAYFAGYVLEEVRLGLVNMILHLPKFPGNYVNHTIPNKSQNNIVLGLLTLGFGWHNNHHANGRKLILTERWWEIDIEGYVGWMLGKMFGARTK